MAKSKRSEGPTSRASKKPAKAIASVVEVEAFESDYLEVDGVTMLWKSRTYITGLGTVVGKVLKSDFDKFTKAVKHLKTDPYNWVSSDDLMAAAKKESQNKIATRNGFS